MNSNSAEGGRTVPDVDWIERPDYTFDESRMGRARGTPTADFQIDGEASHGIPHFVHLFGIESPGLGSALKIADCVTEAFNASEHDLATI